MTFSKQKDFIIREFNTMSLSILGWSQSPWQGVIYNLAEDWFK